YLLHYLLSPFLPPSFLYSIPFFHAIPFSFCSSLFFFNYPAPTEIYTLSLHDALPISRSPSSPRLLAVTPFAPSAPSAVFAAIFRSEEHTSELQSRGHLVCRLLLEKKKKRGAITIIPDD